MEHRYDSRTKAPTLTTEWVFCLEHQTYEHGEEEPPKQAKSDNTLFLRRLASSIGLEICSNPKCVASFPNKEVPHTHDIL